MTIQFYHDGTSSVSLAVWIYIVPNKTMRNPFLLDGNSPMHFHLHSYQTLLLQHDGCFFGELTLWHMCDDVHIRAAAYILNCEASGVA